MLPSGGIYARDFSPGDFGKLDCECAYTATGSIDQHLLSRLQHNWENWRDRLREGLSWLFPGPLWMVYE